MEKYLIIYDIIDNKKRYRLVKVLEGFGVRVQKSAFETMLTKDKLKSLISKCKKYVAEEDSLRIYRIVDNIELSTRASNCMITSLVVI